MTREEFEKRIGAPICNEIYEKLKSIYDMGFYDGKKVVAKNATSELVGNSEELGTSKKKLAVAESCEDCINRVELLKAIDTWDKFGIDDTNHLFRLDNLSFPHYVPYIHYDDVIKCIKGMPKAEQEPKTDKYEYHTDHTDCIWYGRGCPVTCSQYRDGWNDAMEYIYKNGKGYQPYRRK